MSELSELFKLQSWGDRRFNFDKQRIVNDPKYRLEFVKDHVLGMYEQVSNLMSTFNWKRHTFDQMEYDRHNTLEQIVDVTKYAVSLATNLGFTEKEFLDLFNEKTVALDKRWDAMEVSMKEGVNVVLWDIDGCIADYSSGYEAFLSSKGLKSNKDRTSYSFSATYGITKSAEEALHTEFIQSGGFKNLGMYAGAKNIMVKMRKAGIKLVLITARPAWIHKRLVHDTYGWLDDVGIPYDVLLWDKDKADAVMNHVFPANVLGFIEDRDKHAMEISHLGIDVLLIDKSYNRSLNNMKHVRRVSTYGEIHEYIMTKLANFSAK